MFGGTDTIPVGTPPVNTAPDTTAATPVAAATSHPIRTFLSPIKDCVNWLGRTVRNVTGILPWPLNAVADAAIRAAPYMCALMTLPWYATFAICIADVAFQILSNEDGSWNLNNFSNAFGFHACISVGKSLTHAFKGCNVISSLCMATMSAIVAGTCFIQGRMFSSYN